MVRRGRPVNAFRRYVEASAGTNTERAAAFSDAVFAIAMTLLAVEIHVPAVPPERLVAALAGQWVDFAAYALSFLVVGAYWLSHHRLFGLLDRFTAGLLRLNLLVLLLVGLTGYVTALLVEYGNHAPAVMAYAALVTAIGLGQTCLWLYARANHLFGPRVDAALFGYLLRRSLITPVVFGTSVPLALLDADLAKYAWTTVLFLYVVLMLVARATPVAPAEAPGREP